MAGQLYSVCPEDKTGKQGMCTHKHEKHPNRKSGTGVFFWLVEALPQTLCEHNQCSGQRILRLRNFNCFIGRRFVLMRQRCEDIL